MIRIVALALLSCSLLAGAIYLLPTTSAPDHPTGVNTAADLSFREATNQSGVPRNFAVPLSLVPVPPPVETAPPARMERLRIQGIGVDAPLAIAGRDQRGVMDVPQDAKTVAWYDFTSAPGSGSNAVFAGHLDFQGVGPAVFWNLRKLRVGDTIEVTMSDGSTLRYQVVTNRSYSLRNAPVQDIIGPTTFDAITLITCSGTFHSGLRQYDERLIVRAQRVW